jgi:nucleotide-binding universal stress UspA family protein
MLAKLIVPLNGSPESAIALPLARAVAESTGARLCLVRVILPQVEGPLSDEAVEAATYLTRIADELRAGGVRVETLVCQGDSPSAEIVRETRQQGAGLVVIATHGRGGLRRAVLGSMAEHVVAESPVPVLVARPGGHRVTRLTTLLVPVDGSPGSALALGAAVPLAQATSAKLVLLQVVVPWVGSPASPWLLIDPDWNAHVLKSAQHYISGLTARLQQAGLAVEGRAVTAHGLQTGIGATGNITEIILNTAEEVDADIVVMITHAWLGPMRTVLGSVADEVVRTGKRPVLLVRRPR